RGLRPDHDGNRRGAAVLLRRGVSPAVPGEEPRRLLWHRRHGRKLPDWRKHRSQKLVIMAAMSRVVYADNAATPDQELLREAHQVRVVSEAEEGTGVNALPGGVYGFTYSPGLPSAPLF